jgi:hypothetical protein
MDKTVFNKATVSGDETEVAALLMLASSEDNLFKLNKVLPMPAAYYNNEYSASEWKTANWGIHDDLDQEAKTFFLQEYQATDGESGFSLFYETQEFPITEFWTSISKKYSSLVINERYYSFEEKVIGENLIFQGNSIDFEDALSEEYLLAAGAVLNNDGTIDEKNSPKIEIWSIFPIVDFEIPNIPPVVDVPISTQPKLANSGLKIDSDEEEITL